MASSEVFRLIYETLYGFFGHQDWWPADTPFEVLVGAVLTQNTNWNNVEKALLNLKNQDCLTPSALAQIEETRLQGMIRPAGYFRQKSSRLKNIAHWVVEKCGDDRQLTELMSHNKSTLREELLGLKGIGPETADSILLYALQKPVFVVDAYTARVLGRHGLIFPESGYEEIQMECESNLPEDIALYSDFHAQIVELGKRFCKKSQPRCDQCPLPPVIGEPELIF